MAPINHVQVNVEEELEVTDNINKIMCEMKDSIVSEAHELKKT